ncbi:MAG: hypothetical protein DF168_01131 [Candidatus Moanabacter tarae]|uniref:Uncharacterized protein n=1 Tax=Candidatus Moanibacter tarae TaxID=2200854 RepID=A0A2Z4ACR0_9BACT|nr:MAG: hypothetical protein DF168_01131 [Candidatus Moanabacter tarae]|tara:strand:- start:5053 stop:5985 length:933 start_codon:yes stop_codon:yes gene_type:complete
MGRSVLILTAILFFIVFASGCSTKDIAIKKIANILASGSNVFASDEDPEFVKVAIPFSLKLMESLLKEVPAHESLLLATSSGFAQYAYAFIQQEADVLEEIDFSASREKRKRAARLYLRARDYGMRGLEIRHRDFEEVLWEDSELALSSTSIEDVPFLYWTATAWAGAISMSKDNPDLISDLPIVEAMIARAFELDESFDYGALHSFLISYEMIRPNSSGNPELRARGHFNRALQLSQNRLASPMVTMAESVSIQKQNRQEFEELLSQALQIDANHHPEWRLVNIIMQRRARWLLSRTDELFLSIPKERE